MARNGYISGSAALVGRGLRYRRGLGPLLSGVASAASAPAALLANPNGVFFSSTSRVDVAGLVAPSSGMSTADFMCGNMRFTQPGRSDASIVNEGQITVREAGLLAFVAPQVENRGLIEAQLGTV